MIKFDGHTRLKELLISFEKDSDLTISELYRVFRNEFLIFVERISKNQEVNLDCFQEAVISVYENLRNNKITQDKSTVKTYLFAIGKNNVLNAIKKKKDLPLNEGAELIPEQGSRSEESSYRKTLLLSGMDQLGEKCKEILIKFYYDKYSIEAIKKEMSYKNENTVKAHKSRCLSQLRELLTNIKQL